MLNFAVGPVPSDLRVRALGGGRLPVLSHARVFPGYTRKQTNAVQPCFCAKGLKGNIPN